MKKSFTCIRRRVALAITAVWLCPLICVGAKIHVLAGVRHTNVVTVTVSGKITDEKGNGLPGVTVLEKGTCNGTSTNENGDYTITVSDGNSRSAFSFIGFLAQEEAVSNRTSISIQLVPEDKSLN